MITFIPAWQHHMTDIPSDDLIGQIKSFMFSETAYQVLIGDYMPNLRYFLHKYGLLESNYVNLFDQLQDFTELVQRKIELDDLGLGLDVSYIYTPFNILGYKNETKVAAIKIGDGGQIFEVYHYRNEKLSLIDIYDDRGILSSQKAFVNDHLFTTTYLNINGDWVIKEFAATGEVQVNTKHPHGLISSRYESVEALRQELIDTTLKAYSGDNRVIISLTDENYGFVKKSRFINQMTISLLGDRFNFLAIEREEMLDVVSNVNNVLVDRQKTFDSIVQFVGNRDHIYQISPYDTRFKFGMSNELKEEIIYFDSSNITDIDFRTVMRELIDFIVDKKTTSASRREFKLIIRHLNGLNTHFKNIMGALFSEMYPDEYELISQMSLRAGENTIDEDFINKVDSKVEIIMQTMNQIEFFEYRFDDQLFEILDRTRLIIDVSEDPDLFTQIAAISTGIPQINHVENEYVLHQQNGLIINDLTDLKNGLAYYLDQLKHWQEAQVYAAKQIKKYSGNELKQKLLQIIVGQENG